MHEELHRDSERAGGSSAICAACGQASTTLPSCSLCGQPATLRGRYVLREVLGHGASGTTYRAEVAETGALVAIKELLGRSIDSLKTAELFEREAQVLAELDHPAIPALLEHFSEGQGKRAAFYLVQQLVQGQSLAEQMRVERREEPAIIADLVAVLRVCEYLHSLRPPVIHRDIKPSNVMRRDNGQLALIDFGAVRAAVHDDAVGGSTIAGTFGYMAPEQFTGRALPQSDLYAVGALAVALLARQDAQVFVDHDNRLDWRGKVHCSEALGAILEQLLQRDPELRPSDASRVADRLEAIAAGKPDPDAHRLPTPAPPTGLTNAWVQPPPTPRPGSWLRIARQRPLDQFNLLFGALFGGIGGGVGLTVGTVGFLTGESIMALIGGSIGLLFGLLGGGFFAVGLRSVLRHRDLWRDGKVAKGRVVEVARDRTLRVNGQSPLSIAYEFQAGGRTVPGRQRSFAPRARALGPGSVVAVVYDPADPERNTIHLGD